MWFLQRVASPANDAFCSFCQTTINQTVFVRDPPATTMNELDPKSDSQDFPPPKPAGKVYKVPRKFDLAMIFVVTSAYSVAFGLMQALNFVWPAQVAIMMLFTMVGLIQMFAPERMVRTASVIAGMLCMAIVFTVVMVIEGARSPSDIFFGVLCTVFGFGTFLGYCVGVLVSSVFMLTDYARMIFGRNKSALLFLMLTAVRIG